MALGKVQTVGFKKLAIAFEAKAKTSSSLRRIQRFMANYVFDTDSMARIIFVLVLIAFTWAYKIGIKLDKLKPIVIKKHGRRAYSFFKYGLNILAKILNNNDLIQFCDYVKFLSCA